MAGMGCMLAAHIVFSFVFGASVVVAEDVAISNKVKEVTSIGRSVISDGGDLRRRAVAVDPIAQIPTGSKVVTLREPIGQENMSQQSIMVNARDDNELASSSFSPSVTTTTFVAHANLGGLVPAVESAELTDIVPQIPGELGFLSPSAASPLPQEVGSSAYVAGVWLVVFAITVVLVRCCLSSSKSLRICMYDRLPDTDTDEPPISTSRAPPVGQTSRTQLFHIGSPSGSRTSSPGPAFLSRSCSETEPECELFPSSTDNSPRERVISRVALVPPTSTTADRQERGAPPAAVLGRPMSSPVAYGEMELRSQTIVQEASPLTQGGHVCGRVALLYASPLCYRDDEQGLVPMVQIPFQKEWDVIVQAYDEAAAALREAHCSGGLTAPVPPRPGVTLSAQPLTAGSLQRAVAPVTTSGAATVLHLSAHGFRDSLVLEDGRGTGHLCGSEMLHDMLELQGTPRVRGAGDSGGGVRLVILNACRLRAVGSQFAHSGVPHVIGCSVDLRDATSQVFLRAFYGSLFQGSSVLRAFNTALVAVRSDADATTRHAAETFYLLPEGDNKQHQMVLFPVERPVVEEGTDISMSIHGRPSTGLTTSVVAFEESQHGSHASTSMPSLASMVQSRSSDCTVAAGEGSISSSNVGPCGCNSTDTVSCGSSSCDESCSSENSDRPRIASTVSSNSISPRPRSLLSYSRRRVSTEMAASVARSPVAEASAFLSRAQFVSQRDQVLAARSVAMAGTKLPTVVQSPFGRALPPMPEDFLGRARDVWAVLQHLHSRRAVVVCGDHKEDNRAPCVQHGIGKSAVLDATHRAFVLHMGGVCVAVQMRALSEAEAVVGCGGWVEKVRASVRLALRECQDQWWPCEGDACAPRSVPTTLAVPHIRTARGPSMLRRRPARPGGPPRASIGRQCGVSHGFHPLSDPIALRPAVEELIADMCLLSDLCEVRQREWPAASGQVLLLLDECDHLIQQQPFQDAVADILQRCAAYRIVLSTHQPMVGTAGGLFKVVHQPIAGLAPEDAARLFLRRVQRPLRWEELMDPLQLLPEGASSHATAQLAMAKVGAKDPRRPVIMAKANEGEVLQLVASHPSVTAQFGNPRRLIELASRVGPMLKSLSELAPRSAQRTAVASCSEPGGTMVDSVMRTGRGA
mmetsp:Transcript_37665/g.99626  ORF Transcript_37665/g.99626 Transcript_37665/m.99626 type:complete len:1146 (-) Transcript_37665:359-3796(-)